MGELMAAVDRARLRDNTLVFLTSDNGPYQEEGWENSGAAAGVPKLFEAADLRSDKISAVTGRVNLYDASGHRVGRLRGGKGQVRAQRVFAAEYR